MTMTPQPQFELRELRQDEVMNPFADFYINCCVSRPKPIRPPAIPVSGLESCCSAYRITLKSQPMPEAKEGTKLQLEAGKFYRNRKGEKIGPMKLVSEHGNLLWPWTDGSTMFMEHGEYDTKPSEYDLIAPWTDEPQASEPIERVMGPDEIIRKGDTCVWSDGDIITAEHAIGTTVALAKACWKNACEYRTTRPKPSEPVPSQEYLTKMADAEDQCRSVAVGNFDTSNRDAILEAAERYADRRYRAGYECGKHGKKDLAAEGAASVAFQKFIEALNQ